MTLSMQLLQEAQTSMVPPRILLAGDGLGIHHLLREALEEEGYEVAWARDRLALGEELRSGEGRQWFDLFLASAGERSEVDLLEKVRSVDSSTPFLLLAPGGDQVVRRDARRLGISVFEDLDQLLEHVLHSLPPTLYEEGW